jgi:hypothetical protein
MIDTGKKKQKPSTTPKKTTLTPSLIKNIEQLLALMEQYTVTTLKCGDIELERPPILSKPKPSVSSASPLDDMPDEFAPTTPEELEASLHALGRSLD